MQQDHGTRNGDVSTSWAGLNDLRFFFLLKRQPFRPAFSARADALPGPLRRHDREIVSARRGSKWMTDERERNPVHA
jgi:hypothetical protein